MGRKPATGFEEQQGVQYWRSPLLPTVLFMDGSRLDMVFPRHSHETYAFGTVESGALGFNYRGESLVALPNMISLAIPGETHDGHSATEQGWSYRMSYVEPDTIRHAASELWGKDYGLPFIKKGVLDAPDLAPLFRKLHVGLREKSMDELEASTLWIFFISVILKRHGEYPEERFSRPDIRKACEFLRENMSQKIFLKDLADLVSLSPWHFLRSFSRETGLTPHAFLTQMRVRQVERLLRSGFTPAQAAAATGFADQSHLIRCFQKIMGTTPSRFLKGS